MFRRNFIPLYFTLTMWAVFLFEQTSHTDLGFLGINPRNVLNLPCIFTAPLVHGDWSHILNNSFSFLILGLILFNNYPKISGLVFFMLYLSTGLLVWLVARSGIYHIGMSGVIYGMASFIFFSGFYRGNKEAIALSLLTALLYGGMAWGILPYQPGISWESHLSGAVTGMAVAFIFRDIHAGGDMEPKKEEKIPGQKDFDDFLNQK